MMEVTYRTYVCFVHDSKFVPVKKGRHSRNPLKQLQFLPQIQNVLIRVTHDSLQ
jgi:hypothetical protein